MPRSRVAPWVAFALLQACARTDEAPPPVAAPPAVAAQPTVAAVPTAPAVAVAGAVAPYVGVPCAAVPAGAEDLAPLLEPIRQKYNLPALGAAVVTPDVIKALGIAGVRRYGDPTPACIDDAFLLASNTKALSAVVIAKLVEQGRLSWSTTIGQVFSDVPRNPAYDGVTLEMLLAHRAGFAHDPRSVGFGKLRALGGSLHDQREQYARIVLAEAPVNTPGTAYQYSNTSYTIAGLMAERRTGQAWEDLITSIVFSPLGMAGAGFGPTATVGRVDGLWPHAPGPAPLEPDLSSINPLFRTPAGNVHLPMASWGRFIVEELRSFEGRGGLLAPATYQHMHTVPFGGNYAYGWQVVQRNWAGGEAYTHTGTDGHNSSVAWVVPRFKVGIVVGSNVGKAFRGLDEVVQVIRQHVPGMGGGPAEPQEAPVEQE